MQYSNLNQQIGFWLGRLNAQIHNGFEQCLNPYDITIPEWNVMRCVHDRQADSVTTLAKFIQIDKAAISRTVEKLAQKQHILVIPGKDRRSQQIFITQQGKELTTTLLEITYNFQQQILSVLTPEEIYQFEIILKKMLSVNARN